MVFTKKAIERIKRIHKMSKQVNSSYNHRKKLLDLAKKHIAEIQQLYKENSSHADIETGDLAVLCFELILESKKDLDKIIETCFDRYEKKLKEIEKSQL